MQALFFHDIYPASQCVFKIGNQPAWKEGSGLGASRFERKIKVTVGPSFVAHEEAENFDARDAVTICAIVESIPITRL